MPTTTDGRLLGGRYLLGEVLGRGGMGVVWAGHDEVLGRDVAVKEVVPPAELVPEDRDRLRRRTLREARAAARISSRAALTVFDVVEEDGRPWIVMERLSARSLADVLRDAGPQPPAAVARIGLDVLEALEAASAAGVLHRDVKPANVLLRPEGGAVLADFGIATLEGDSALTTTGVVLGSPAYMAPERARGERPTLASDLWSLGATLYAALEGRAPFERDGPLQTLSAVLQDPTPPPTKDGPLARVVEWLLLKEPSSRPSLREARAALQEALVESEVARTRPLDPVTTTATTPAATVVDEPAPAPMPEPAAVIGLAPAPVTEPGAAPSAVSEAAPAPVTEPEAAPSAVSEAAPAPVTEPEAAPAPEAEPAREPWQEDILPWPDPPPGERTQVVRTPPGRRRRRLLLVLLATLVLGAVGAPLLYEAWSRAEDSRDSPEAGASGDPADGDSSAGSAGPSPSSPSSTAGASGAGGVAGSGQAPSASASAPAAAPSVVAPEPAPAVGAPAPLPAGFRLHADPTGFTVAVPEGWERSTSDTRTWFREPDGSRYLLVDQTTQPKDDALADWQANEPSVSRRFPGYERISLARVDYRGWNAADWEYTYDGSSARVHVLNRNVRVSDGRAYALYWSTPDRQWAESRPLFDVVAAAFQPAPG